MYHRLILFVTCLLSLYSCNNGSKSTDSAKIQKLFTLIPAEQSGVDFNNYLHENHIHNALYYDYYYNGGGVATGDINNDGLPDLYFTGNTTGNKLYLNQGNFKFKDITNIAGVAVDDSWSTGVTMADVNGDGYLDIHVCRSYINIFERFFEKTRNLLFINNGDLTFTESAAEYGIDDRAFSTQASFFDFDLDGDLDMYLGNHPVDWRPESPKFRYDLWVKPQLDHSSDRLYRNENGKKFTDITKEAGLYNYSFSLGVVAADLTEDGLPDLYIANDFEHPDNFYVNNGDGTFTDKLKESFQHICFFGMGIDIADFNNDAKLDIIELDMASEDHYRSKTQMAAMDVEEFWLYVDVGYHYQFMRNMLHMNNGNGHFSEIGQMAGIAKTDWSWSALFADFNNDSYNDLYVTNGYRRDGRFNDYRTKYAEKYSGQNVFTPEEFQDIISMIPSEKLTNYLFLNTGELDFKVSGKSEGMNQKSFSHGAAYADLDNDGDLDLVVNNQMDPAFIYRNNSVENGDGNYLQVKLLGKDLNTSGLGAKVTLKYSDKVQFREHTLTRGYQSSMDDLIHFGLGKDDQLDELIVVWPDSSASIISNPQINQRLLVDQADAVQKKFEPAKKDQLFVDVSDKTGIGFKHEENDFDDYEREILLPHKMSQHGPAIASGDINGNGLDDLFIGGARGQSGVLYKQKQDGTFSKVSNPALTKYASHEDVGSVFFDADGDGDLDLFVVSGGNEAEGEDHKTYQDRLFINNGSGSLTDKTGLLPEIHASGSCVEAGDFNNDGFEDLFIGGRQSPGRYPYPGRSYLLKNNAGNGFVDVTEEIAPELERIGMVTSAEWVEVDGDGDLDLVVAGEWMPLTVFENSDDGFINSTEKYGLGSSNGWWFSLASADIDSDGDIDLIAGNLGENYKYKASQEKPFPIYCDDFDNNGSLDIVLGYRKGDKLLPVRGRECSSEQMPVIAEKFPTYDAFGKATLKDIYGEDLSTALHYEAYTFSSSLIINNGDGSFSIKKLPKIAQIAPINGIIVEDLNNDNKADLIVAGNLYEAEIETGSADAGTGAVLLNLSNGNFQPVPIAESGLFANGNVKNIVKVKSIDDSDYFVVANNDDELQIFRSNNSQ